MKIGILSDTHGHLDDRFLKFFENCDELWHAGDIGSTEIFHKIGRFKPTVWVYGNIDGAEIRLLCPHEQVFEREGLKVFMTHIAGYPTRYNASAKANILKHKPDMVICGHSHILKVIYDSQFNHLHVNPGAAGNHGWHKVRTAVRFDIVNGKPAGMELFELPRQ